MPRLSIVIPCVQDAVQFEATLASVLQNRPAECEVLVVQPRAYDDPYELGREVRFIEASADSTTADLLNVGVGVSTGLVVHVLTCDAEVTDGWTDSIWSHFSDATVGAVSPVVMTADGQRVVSRGVRYGVGGRRAVRVIGLSKRRSSRGVDGPALTAGFYRRQALVDAGGFSREVGDEFADADLAAYLRSAGWRTVHEASSVVTTNAAVDRRRPSFRRGREAERLFWRNASITSGWFACTAHAGVWIGDVLSHLLHPTLALQLLGRACGTFEASRYRRRRELLRKVQEAAGAAGPQTVPFTRRQDAPRACEQIRPRSAA